MLSLYIAKLKCPYCLAICRQLNAASIHLTKLIVVSRLYKGKPMSIEAIVLKQYRDKVDQAVIRFDGYSMPVSEGWLKTVRKALCMTGAQLAKRLGVTKGRVSQAESGELSGGVTLRTMQAMAEAMGCRFVYAVVPDRNIESVIKDQAIIKAKARVKAASTHMALEAQSLDKDTLDSEIERIASEIMRKIPADFWNEK